MQNLFLVLIIAFYLQNCYLHSVSIQSKTGMQKYSQSKIQSKKSKSIPVKVNFGKTNAESFYINIFLGSEELKKELELKNNYFTEEYFSKFQRSNFFYLANNSNLRIEINAYPGKRGGESEISMFYFYSLGIIPYKLDMYGIIQFDIFDSKKKEKIKSFQYEIEHRLYEGLTPVLAGVFLPIFSDRFDHSKNFSTYAIARVAFNEFEEDFLDEFKNNEELRKAAYLHNPPVYKIQNPTKEEIAKNPYLPYLIAKLESKLLQRGIEIIKQDDSPKSPSSTKADQVIKIDSLNILKDSISISISCLDIKNNSEAWVEKVNLSANADNTESTLDKAVDKLIENLVSKGEIN